ncbi:MAG: UDP-N-acetylmuramoyl-tripeptide--D-alanyl-D-alanine ligase [Solirubrobacteraceae bacterium]
MREWAPGRVARAAGASLVTGTAGSVGPDSATIDSRDAGPGALFVGLPGASVDGGMFAEEALRTGAWGTLTAPSHARAVAATAGDGAVVLAAEDPLAALQALASEWRRELVAAGARVVGVTGSTGKTTTKELLLALLAPRRRTVASRANFNTEIGLPLEVLAAPAGTEVLVLEMGMRGPGQIAELAGIAAPDVGVIVNIGPVHLELMGSLQAIAAAKAELVAALPAGGTAVVPADEPLLKPHLRDDVTTMTFGEQGDVRLVAADGEHVEIDAGGERVSLEVAFTQPHLRVDLLAAVAATIAIGVTPDGRVQLALGAGRGRRSTLANRVTVIDDCYNANPISMRAALDDLRATAARHRDARRVAVLGDMLELGPDERDYHLVLGEQATAAGVDLLVTVGPLAASIADRFAGGAHRSVADAREAAALVPGLIEPGDVVLVKGSRGVGLELVCSALGARGAQ